MKFHNLLVIIVLCTIGSINARTMGTTAPKPVITGQPTNQPVVTPPQKPVINTQQPTVQINTFAQLSNKIKGGGILIWDKGSQLLNQNFVNTLVNDAKAAKITDDQLEFLLNMARDYHAQFRGNREQDIKILNALAAQRETAKTNFSL